MKKDSNDEIMLVRSAAGGSREAFCGLYGIYKDKLYRYALYRLKDPDSAEDAVSDCVLAAWKNIGALKSDKAFGSWIFGILRNVCAGMIKSEIRARESMGTIYENTLPLSESSPSTYIELREALNQLTDEDREIVLLSVVSGLKSKEISAITGLAPGSVRSRLSRSMSKMRDFLA